MDYFINFLRPNKRSKFRIYSGSFILVMGILYGIIGFRTMVYYNWVLCGAYVILGLIFLLNGLGVGVKQTSAKAYISITDTYIYFKPTRWVAEERAHWNDIKSIGYKSRRFVIERKDDTNFEIFSDNCLSFQNIQEIKSILQEMANNHQIPFILE